MRFVLDTNLPVSGLIAVGLPRWLFDDARAGEFELCTSEVLLAELRDVLSRAKFADRLGQAGLTPMGIVDDLRRMAVVVLPTVTPRVVPTDPDDDHVIAAGDKRDLLPMGSWAGTPIVTAREAVERLEARREA